MRTSARWLVVFSLACFGFIFGASIAQAQEGETVVQGSQSSDSSAAETGGATGENFADFVGGPSATGFDSANASQLGQNSASVSQSGSAKSGDPVAGAQVTGAVADNVTVQNQNTAIDPVAISGFADVINDAVVTLGPSADSVFGTAQASQVGDNLADVAQAGLAESGDAVAGSQVTGIVGGGEHVVQNQNYSDFGLAISGDAFVDNFADFAAGPFAISDTAQAGQIGDNDAVLSQSSEVNTGDALAGAQVSGVVGGSATVQKQNTSIDNEADSGFAFSTNDFVATVGPSAVGLFFNAQASQTGDNTVAVAQDASGASGDAVAGSQVTGGVGDQGGFFTVQNQQASEGDIAFTGDIDFLNFGDVFVGPNAFGFTVAQASQNGDNDVAIAQTIDAETGDALAGAQVTGAVGHHDVTVQNQNTATFGTAFSGFAFVTNDVIANAGPLADFADDTQASQIGDNSLALDQAVTAASGDAVAGGQVTGVVAAGSTVEIQNQNYSEFNLAVTGDVDVAQFVTANAGPEAFGFFTAQATQNGDNALAVAQAVEAASGDAVSGGQVSGVVAGSGAEITIQNQNTSFFDEADSGFVFVVNDAVVAAGPLADFADDAQASQLGDNVLSLDQAVVADSGDAVAGSQVTGAVAGSGSEVTIQNQNTSDSALSFTGDVFADNFAEAFAGPAAFGFFTASASQIGDNVLAFGQDLAVSSGDAVAGSQVSGVVGTTDATIQVSNNDVFSAAFSGFVDGFNTAFGTLTATAEADVAHATQNGDTDLVGGQSLTTESGDGVAGAQVSGIVGSSTGSALPASSSDGSLAGVSGT